MKTKLILSSILALLCLSVLSGCTTASPSTIQHIATAARITSKDATYFVLKNNPQLRPQFVLAREELTIIGNATNLNFNLAVDIVTKFPIKEVNDPALSIVIGDAQLILSDLNLTYPLTQVENLRPIVIGLRDGVDDGLKLAP